MDELDGATKYELDPEVPAKPKILLNGTAADATDD